MKRLTLLLLLLAAFGPARASVDLSAGSLYRTAGVPAWTPSSGTFTIMLWVYAPNITGANDYFEADDGNSTYAGLGSAVDSPTEPYFLTKASEFHFNTDGSYIANPPKSFDVSLGWTFLAASFTANAGTQMYAWQAGVNGDKLVHIAAQATGSTIGGTGTIKTFNIGNTSMFNEGCACLVGPVYVYDGVALTQDEVDAQRLALAPIVKTGLRVYSSFDGTAAVTTDQSGTADWTVHGTVSLNASNPPVPGIGSSSGGSSSSSSSSGGGSSSSGSSSSSSSSGGSSSGGSSSGGSGSGSGGGDGGAVPPALLLALLGAVAWRRRALR